jgi:hypothetical protein
MFEGKFVTNLDYPGVVGPILSVFGIHPKNIGRLSGYSFRRMSWSWSLRTYEIRSSWIPEKNLEDYRVATAARVYFRDRPDITYRDPLTDFSIQRTEVFFEIFENNAWSLVWRHVFEYGELASLRSAFHDAFGAINTLSWEIVLPELPDKNSL